MNLVQSKKAYYKSLDDTALVIANEVVAYRSEKEPVASISLMKEIANLYSSAKAEQFFKDDDFEAAYHSPISNDLEFLLSRILYHYAKLKKLSWKIYLRRQVGKAAPDIRIERDGKTIAVLEVKAKAGWIQAFFSRDREKSERKQLRAGRSYQDPRETIKRVRSQIDKYAKIYDIPRTSVFVFLPSFTHVHRVRSGRSVGDYIEDFVRNSKLKKKNLILLSNNPSLDLSNTNDEAVFNPTNNFEKFIKGIVACPQCKRPTKDLYRIGGKRIEGTKEINGEHVCKKCEEKYKIEKLIE